ncbi:phosphate regulon sensor histidine kinase PhoR [Marisediminitalea sp.]|uniref:phosphate regulon sensor histidine kinase PhoR n=1 Tax=Marisediminitalea sp. TaxID=2662268 RepID=UPI000C465BA2|nr:two-component system sensor histidine kinase PhoR [Alteromonadaceae bacterium]MAX42951.1 two-component system sensor histidine kinase PhoR [Alteromonadaceae bacterium]HBY39448.1 two-component system sensor histidine kinase PhoR [Alteromonas sp.]|tara:strand:- start:18834 stop:20147 length:1314 start_codon:yes stop_codon:yes gene_type:complete
MYYPFSWFKSIVRLCLFLIVFALVGWYLDDMLLAVALGATGLLLLNYWHLYKLNRWLWHSRKMSPPSVNGLWEHIYEGIYYLQRRNRNKRKELGALVKRFREGSEALPDAAVVVDAKACIIWCNRLARLELGLRWPSDAGRRLDNLIRHPEFIQYFHAGKYHYPIEVPSPLNPQKTFEYRIMPYGEEHLLLIARDVTRVSQLEEMRKDFVANVSHELRTPLTVINGYLEILAGSGDELDPLTQKAFLEMSSQTQRMQSLIEDLLVLSRIEASSERIYENTVDMPAMLRQIKLEADALNKDKGHTIAFHLDEGVKIYGIETELRSACSNLIFNAINYTPPGGHIDVYWSVTKDGVKFAVKDDGDGIEQRHLSRLTERFYRVDKARSRKTGGSGLGLSIVKHVLNHHNSQLQITSVVGEGSVFFFNFDAEMIASQDPVL